MWASTEGHAHVVDLLLEHDAQIDLLAHVSTRIESWCAFGINFPEKSLSFRVL